MTQIRDVTDSMITIPIICNSLIHNSGCLTSVQPFFDEIGSDVVYSIYSKHYFNSWVIEFGKRTPLGEYIFPGDN